MDPAVPDRVHAPEPGVVLGAGPFKSSMEANILYLLADANLDDMLFTFRQLAGNPNPPGQKRGWENMFPAHAAQFLMGAGNTLHWMEHPLLRERLDRLLEEIKACRTPEGYLLVPSLGAGPLLPPPDMSIWGFSSSYFAEGMVAAGRAGSRTAYELLAAGNRKYREIILAAPAKLALKTHMNYQGHLASMLACLSPVGTPEDIRAAEHQFVSPEWMRLLAERDPRGIWQAPLLSSHSALTYGFEAYLDQYRATGERQYLEASLGAWELMHEHWEHVGGTLAICESEAYRGVYAYPPKCYPLTTKRHVGELCASVFWLRFNHRFHLLFPEEERFADEIEKCIYNVALAGQDPDGKGMHYHLPLEGRKNQHDLRMGMPVPSIIHTCCEGASTWLYGNLPEYLFSIDDDGLWWNLYHPSSVTWKRGDRRVRLAVETGFPEDGEVMARIETDRPAPMVLRLRIPRWCSGDVPVMVDGRLAAVGTPGTYLTVDRTWNRGEKISFSLPLDFQAHHYAAGEDRIPGKERYAVTCGPLLLAWVGSPDEGVLEIPYESARIDEWLRPDPNRSLEFRVEGSADCRFIPYCKVGHDQAFTCYPVMK